MKNNNDNNKDNNIVDSKEAKYFADMVLEEMEQCMDDEDFESLSDKEIENLSNIAQRIGGILHRQEIECQALLEEASAFDIQEYSEALACSMRENLHQFVIAICDKFDVDSSM